MSIVSSSILAFDSTPRSRCKNCRFFEKSSRFQKIEGWGTCKRNPKDPFPIMGNDLILICWVDRFPKTVRFWMDKQNDKSR